MALPGLLEYNMALLRACENLSGPLGPLKEYRAHIYIISLPNLALVLVSYAPVSVGENSHIGTYQCNQVVSASSYAENHTQFQ